MGKGEIGSGRGSGKADPVRGGGGGENRIRGEVLGRGRWTRSCPRPQERAFSLPTRAFCSFWRELVARMRFGMIPAFRFGVIGV